MQGSPASNLDDAYSSHSSDLLARSEFHEVRSNRLIGEDNFQSLAVSQRQDDMEPVREGELRKKRGVNLRNTEINTARPMGLDMMSQNSGPVIEVATSDFADEDIIERHDRLRDSDSNSHASRNSKLGRAPLSTRSLRTKANLGYTTSKHQHRSSFDFDLEEQDA